MNLDERLEALTGNMELQHREGEAQRERIDALRGAIEIDAENIRALARIAGAHQQRIERLESGQ